MYPTPIMTVDVVLLTLDAGILKVALHRRRNDPFKDALALPGGYIHPQEDRSVTDAAYRILADKTGFVPAYLEHLDVFSGVDRDPRGWSASVSMVALVPIDRLHERRDVFVFHDVNALPPLAFDHLEQIRAAVNRVRNKSSYSTLPCWLLPEVFTLSELQSVYERILGVKLSAATLRARLGVLREDTAERHRPPVLIDTGQVRIGTHRPAKLYRIDKTTLFDRVVF